MLKSILIIQVLPFIFFFFLWYSKYRSKLHWFLRFLFILIFICLISLSPLAYYFPVFLRLLMLAVFFTSSFFSFLKTRKFPYFSKSDWQEVVIILAISVILFFFLSYRPKNIQEPLSGPSVDLSFPLRNGTYFITASGFSPGGFGHDPIHNTTSQKYAIDIIKARSFSEFLISSFKSGLSSYAIFGDYLYSPCNGIVEKTNGENNGGDLPDLIPPERDRVNMDGNHVLISCKGVRIQMAHMMKGSIRVREGDEVKENDIIGKVGNSGNTDGPHLHISATIQKSNDYKDIEPVKISFDGKYPKKNDYIESKN